MKWILFTMLLVSCTPIYHHDYTMNCRNEAVYCGLIANEKNETKVAFGPIPNSIEWHAQSKVKIDGEWRWLVMRGKECYIEKQDSFEPLNEFSVQDFVSFINRKK